LIKSNRRYFILQGLYFRFLFLWQPFFFHKIIDHILRNICCVFTSPFNAFIDISEGYCILCFLLQHDRVNIITEGFSAREDTIDGLPHSIFREGITYMMEDTKNILRCTHYILISRYFERRADHSCKIAKNVHYMETGERIEIK